MIDTRTAEHGAFVLRVALVLLGPGAYAVREIAPLGEPARSPRLA